MRFIYDLWPSPFRAHGFSISKMGTPTPLKVPLQAAELQRAEGRVEEAEAGGVRLQETKNRVHIVLQGKFHRGILNRFRNISDAL